MGQPAQPSIWEEVPENHFLEVAHLTCFFGAIIMGAVFGLLAGLGVQTPLVIMVLATVIPIAFIGLATEPGHRRKSMGRTFIIALAAFVALSLFTQLVLAIANL